MDGAPGLLAEAGIGFSIIKGKVAKLMKLKLVECESQDPGDVS